MTSVDLSRGTVGKDHEMNEHAAFEVEGGTPHDGVSIASPRLLFAYTFALQGRVWLAVYRSSIVKTDRDLYAPVAAYLAEHPDAVLVEERHEENDLMAWHEAFYHLYLIGDAD